MRAILREQAKILAEREKARSRLLLSVSHDLRSPLAAISDAAETLLQQQEDSGRKIGIISACRP